MVTATIKLWDNKVGVVAWDEHTGVASFEYFKEFVALGLDIAPLTMPLSEAKNRKVFNFPSLSTETYNGLPGLLADALPDKYGKTLINAWLAQNGRSPGSMNPVERLCYIGNRGMGALEFEPAISTSDNKSTSLEISGLIEIAREIITQREQFGTQLAPGTEKGLEDIIKVGTSAGGARAKAIIAYNETTNEVRSGQVNAPNGFSHWLIKFDGIESNILASPAGYGRIEFAYYKMAVDCGIQMQECRLYEENDRAHFMTRRFDRIGGDEKIHMQTLCAMKHFDFNSAGAYSYEEAFQAMRELKLPYAAADQLYRRMVFNVMSRNCDDHTKNISFLMDKRGVWALAPAYDMSHAYNPDSHWLKAHNMTINGKREGFSRKDLLSITKHVKIKKPLEIIEKIAGVIAKWGDYATDCGVKESHIQELANSHLLL